MAEAREREPSYAWVVVGVLFFAQAMAMGVRGTIGLLVKPWEAEFGWDRAAVSLTAALGFVVYGRGPGALRALGRPDRAPRDLRSQHRPPRRGIAAVGSIVSLWQAYAIFGVLIMVAVGGASSPTSAVAVARWFTARRGLALGVVAGGSAAGQFVMLPVMAALIERGRLADGVLLAGRRRSSRSGCRSSSSCSGTTRTGTRAAPARRAALAGSPMALTQILGHANFWWLALSFFVCGVTTAGLIDTHFIPHAQDHHVSAVTAASAFGVLSLVNMVFTTLSGAVSDRLGYARLLGWIYAGRAVDPGVPRVRA